MKVTRKNNLSLPCLRAKMGDWMYYITVLQFKEVAKRVKLPREIDRKYQNEQLQLGEWIQRKIEENRLKHIVEYLNKQPQRFFNSLILGIYDGNPTWQEIDFQETDYYNEEKLIGYFSRTFGVLTLDGTESIFAIDGQHRAYSIRKAVKENRSLENDEISVIFVAHKTDENGKIRTRRLFSTLNKYAKPVSQSEIIALSEDNNCAIITRNLVEEFDLFKDKILIIKNRSIRPENVTAFSNIMVLYDIVEKILTDKTIAGIKTNGYLKNKFTTQREEDDVISKETMNMRKLFNQVIKTIPSLNAFFENGTVDRNKKKTSLLFRLIGQNILFDVIKICIDAGLKNQALQYFEKDNFNLSNRIWKQVFWNEETGDIATEKARQRYATLLILDHLGVPIKRTKKDKEIFDNFGIRPKDI